jgi:DNA polymerase epsilon subunit 1
MFSKKQGEDVTASAKIILYSQELVNGELTEQLLRFTQKIYKKLTDEDFPELFGCKLKLRCPALEFIKYVCRILSLDKNIVNQITKLKRDLLVLVNVREFSDEAQFADPSLSFVIPQVRVQFSKDFVQNFFELDLLIEI